MVIRDFQALPPEAADNFGWLFDENLVAIMGALCADDPQGAMYVGGCVRDSLLGKPPLIGPQKGAPDFDIATVLTPDQTIAALRAHNIKAIPTGYDHGTITAVSGQVVAEVTSLRADVETDGRHATVHYTDDWTKDWRRRDFTINAIYLTPEGRLFDPANGLDDLASGRVAFIGVADQRIREDYLRILRFYRFSARFARQLDQPGAAACQTLKHGLAHVSAERIGQELMKILGGPNLRMVLDGLEEGGILLEIWPTPAKRECAGQLAAMGEQVAAEVVLAALWPQATGIELDHALRLSNHQSARRRAAIQAASQFSSTLGEAALKEMLYRLGEEAYTDGVRIIHAAEGGKDIWQQALALPTHWQAPKFPLSGKDFAQRGVKAGPQMGAHLKQAENLWVAAAFPLDQTSLDDIIAQCLSQA